ncbi:unnamed protein product, partial [marine sediment metagenome]
MPQPVSEMFSGQQYRLELIVGVVLSVRDIDQ